jgi:hypothetical protein
MARLIDADALPIVTRGKNHHRKYVFADITDAPTIDAIPVEWLENRLNTLCFEAMGAGALYGDRIGELAKSINEVMKLWQKEQEAR